MNINMQNPKGIKLKTAGTYCAEDINVTPVLEEITVNPTNTKQIIESSTNRAGIKKVTVNAVPTEEKTVTANGTVTPTSGKFLSKVIVNVPASGTDVSDTTATPSNVLVGKYFYGADGVKKEGTIPDHSNETTFSVGAGTGEYYIAPGYYDDIKTKIVLNESAASIIKSGETILGVTGTYSGGGSQTGAGTYTVDLKLTSSDKNYYIEDYNDAIRDLFYSGEVDSIVLTTDKGDISISIGNMGYGITATYDGVTAGTSDSGASTQYLTITGHISITAITVSGMGIVSSTDYGTLILSYLPIVLHGSNGGGGSIISDWTVGFDLSQKTVEFNDSNGISELYNIANTHGYGGNDVHLYISLSDGSQIDCCSGYNSSNYINVSGTKIYENGTYSSAVFGQNVQIVSYKFECGGSYFYDYQAAVDWCVTYFTLS